MEIARYRALYDKYSPREFFDWAAEGRTMEIRFLNDNKGNKFDNWALIEHLSGKFSLDRRYNSLFVTTWDQVKDILLFKWNGKPLTKIYNIYMSVNPKRKINMKSKSGLLYKSYYGGLVGVEAIQNVACDIELKGREGTATEAEIEECIEGAKFIAKMIDCHNYYINISGNGAHLWMKLDPKVEMVLPGHLETPDAIIYDKKQDDFYKQYKTYSRFIEKMDRLIQMHNPRLKVDEGAKDMCRILRAVGSWNVKAGKTPRAVGTVACETLLGYSITQKFLAAEPTIDKSLKKDLKIAKLTRHYRYNALNVHESPLYQLMISQKLPSILSRNHYLEQSFARILRDNNIGVKDIQPLIAQMDLVQGKTMQVDPEYLGDDGPFNSESVNHYCIESKLDPIYPLLEDVPTVQDGFISESHYNTLNSYSDATMNKIGIKIAKPRNYMELKKEIRSLCDKWPKATVFFTLKMAYSSEWDYYDRNKIILQLLNKTRVRK